MELLSVNRAKSVYHDRSRKIKDRLLNKRRRSHLTSEDFTILSNNCWGGFVYQSYGLPYNSPTIGLYFFAADYLKFLKDTDYYLSMNLEFIKPQQSKFYDTLIERHGEVHFPIGLLDDIEIMFMHYHSEAEAYVKWTRRSERINWNKLIVKFNDQNQFQDEMAQDFDNLDYENKLFFSSNPRPEIDSAIFIPGAKKQSEILIDQEPLFSTKHLDITQLINSL